MKSGRNLSSTENEEQIDSIEYNYQNEINQTTYFFPF